MGYRIAIDTGGTFTDVVLADDQTNFILGKAPTNYGRIFVGIEGGLQSIAEQLNSTVGEILARTDFLIYGTTHATNAIIESKTARTAFLVTEGFPDILVVREGGKLHPFDLGIMYPDPYIPRSLTFEIRERIDSDGEIVVPLDEAQAKSVMAELKRNKIEAVAVCFLWSPVNGTHEARIGRIIEQELPGIPYTLSHQLNPIVREYRRASSTAINASLRPLMERHLGDMEKDLRHAGFHGELLVASSFGGVMHVGDLLERPIYLVRSGPSMGPVAGRTYAEAETGAREVIVCDTGGTSFDVSLVRDGVIKFTRDTWLGEIFSGHITGLSSVDVESIGAGGGSIAWVDPGGLLRVGPQSAGSQPGPACYGHGGANATVTDAAVVLGFVDPEYFLGGRMKLDVKCAWDAIGRVGEKINLAPQEAARAIMDIASERMVGAIKEITVNQGVDPRDALIVGGGGAAGLNIIPIARRLDCRHVLVPRTAGALSACGGQYSNIVAEFSLSKFAFSGDFDYDEVNRTLEKIQASVDQFSNGLRQKGLQRFATEFFVEARYAYQVWELDVRLAKGRFDNPGDLDAMVEGFHREHERVFAVKEPGQNIECLYWKGRLTAFLESPALIKVPATTRPPPPPRKDCEAFFAGVGAVRTPRYLGSSLEAGTRIEGPAIIDEPTTTIVVYPQSAVRVTELRNYLVDVEREQNELTR